VFDRGDSSALNVSTKRLKTYGMWQSFTVKYRTRVKRLLSAESCQEWKWKMRS